MLNAYVEKQIIPWLTSHLQMRNTGLQVFTAVQGALMVAYSTKQFLPIIALGLASALAALQWDARNRDVFRRLHTLAERYSERELFGVAEDGMAVDGMHRQALISIKKSGEFNLCQLLLSAGHASHTWSIRIVVFACAFAWVAILIKRILS